MGEIRSGRMKDLRGPGDKRNVKKGNRTYRRHPRVVKRRVRDLKEACKRSEGDLKNAERCERSV